MKTSAVFSIPLFVLLLSVFAIAADKKNVFDKFEEDAEEIDWDGLKDLTYVFSGVRCAIDHDGDEFGEHECKKQLPKRKKEIMKKLYVIKLKVKRESPKTQDEDRRNVTLTNYNFESKRFTFIVDGIMRGLALGDPRPFGKLRSAERFLSSLSKFDRYLPVKMKNAELAKQWREENPFDSFTAEVYFNVRGEYNIYPRVFGGGNLTQSGMWSKLRGIRILNSSGETVVSKRY